MIGVENLLQNTLTLILTTEGLAPHAYQVGNEIQHRINMNGINSLTAGECAWISITYAEYLSARDCGAIPG